jgi:hypothetical protein
MRLVDLFEAVKIDNVKGLGEVPDNQNVDYLGLRVEMRPSVFLRLAHSLPREQAQSADYIQKHLEQGGSIASPWLVISVPPEWETGDLEMPARVVGHEGRNRMYAVMETEGDAPVETHLFFSGGVRRRHITPQWIKRLNNSLIPQGQTLPMGGVFFTTAGATNESTTRTTTKGAPGTLKAKITRHYGGDVTCAKAKKLKSRKTATPHDKAQANWFLNMQDCDESQLGEVFRGEPEHVRWMWNKDDNIVQTKFEYAGHEVDIGLEPVDGSFFDYGPYVAKHHNITIPDDWTGYNITFSVDDSIGITMEFGEKGVQLLGKIVRILRGYLTAHQWDYVTFSGDPGSRNRLYWAMAQRLANEIGGQALQTRNYFTIFKKSLLEAFDYQLPQSKWKVVGQGESHITFDFQIDDNEYTLELMYRPEPQKRGIYEVIFAHKEHGLDVSGTGSAFRVFSAIEQLIKYAIQQQKTVPIKGIFFTAQGSSRQKLYSKLSQLLAKNLGWQVSTDPQDMPYNINPKIEKGFLVQQPKLSEEGGVGRVVKGVNTTSDVGPREVQKQARKFGNITTPDGVPPQIQTNGKFKPVK